MTDSMPSVHQMPQPRHSDTAHRLVGAGGVSRRRGVALANGWNLPTLLPGMAAR